jgi:hypothetical protein
MKEPFVTDSAEVVGPAGACVGSSYDEYQHIGHFPNTQVVPSAVLEALTGSRVLVAP